MERLCKEFTFMIFIALFKASEIYKDGPEYLQYFVKIRGSKRERVRLGQDPDR
jgi:hypothetical protein